MPEEQTGTIDSAINALEEYINYSRQSGQNILWLLIVITVAIFGFVVYLVFAVPQLSETIYYVFAGLFVVVFGVLMAVYRFHLNEVARAAHYKIGFMRIRVAANNHDAEGFLTEVRQSLTDKAFDFSPSSVLGGRAKQVESPLPGHPSSDLSAMLLNKLLEGFEVRKKQ